MRQATRETMPHLLLAGFDTVQLSKRFGLPLHLYNARRIVENFRAFQKVFGQFKLAAEVCYAAKACGFEEILRLIARQDGGVDVASEYELKMALKAGFSPGRIVIHGNAKSDLYLEQAIRLGSLIVANHHNEFERIQAEAKRQRKTVPVLLRLSGFDLKPATAAGIFTAGLWCKFGEAVGNLSSVLTDLSRWTHLDLIGFHVHIGSQISEIEPYRMVIGKLADLSQAYQAIVGKPVGVLDFGGGFPISYVDRRRWNALLAILDRQCSGDHRRPGLPSSGARGAEEDKGKCVTWEGIPGGFRAAPDKRKGTGCQWSGERFHTPYPKEHMLLHLLSGTIPFQGRETPLKKVWNQIGRPKLMVEPGRAVVGDAGITLARVIDLYPVAGGYPLVTLDLGLVNHGTGLVEPDLYPWTLANDLQRKDRRPYKAFVAGRLCFSGDMLSRYLVSFPRKPAPGDLAVIEKTGAYASTFFASQANGFPLPGQLLISSRQEPVVMRPSGHRQS
jgi:diaminopimelate decarboxylase